jgi:cell pole-organizing protein PopZ
MSEQTAPEPTMEEILASIRRIISEDDAPAAAPRGASAAPAEERWESAEIETPAPVEPQAAAEVLMASEAQPDAEPEPVIAAVIAAEAVGELDVHETQAEAAPPAPVAAVVVEPQPVAAVVVEPRPAPPAPAPIEAAPAPQPAVAAPTLVADETATRVASAFDRLAAAAAPSPRPAPPPPSPAAGRSIEDLARELLAPMIKSWLDENLAGIVQTRVDEEVERIVRGRVR